MHVYRKITGLFTEANVLRPYGPEAARLEVMQGTAADREDEPCRQRDAKCKRELKQIYIYNMLAHRRMHHLRVKNYTAQLLTPNEAVEIGAAGFLIYGRIWGARSRAESALRAVRPSRAMLAWASRSMPCLALSILLILSWLLILGVSDDLYAYDAYSS